MKHIKKIILFFVSFIVAFCFYFNFNHTYRIGIELNSFSYLKIDSEQKNVYNKTMLYIDNLYNKKINIDFYYGEEN